MSKLLHNHMEAAIAIAKKLPVKHVVECGVGGISTLWFLDPVLFPDLEILTSLETQAHWLNTVSKDVKDKTKWRTNIVRSEQHMGDFLEPADVMLVDSFTIQGRIAILQSMSKKENVKFIILHDSQYSDYNPVISKFKYSYIFCERDVPATVLSNTVNLSEFFND